MPLPLHLHLHVRFVGVSVGVQWQTIKHLRTITHILFKLVKVLQTHLFDTYTQIPPTHTRYPLSDEPVYTKRPTDNTTQYLNLKLGFKYIVQKTNTCIVTRHWCVAAAATIDVVIAMPSSSSFKLCGEDLEWNSVRMLRPEFALCTHAYVARMEYLLIHFNSIVSLCMSLLNRKTLIKYANTLTLCDPSSCTEYFEFVVRFLAQAIIIAVVVVHLARFHSHRLRLIEAMAEKDTKHLLSIQAVCHYCCAHLQNKCLIRMNINQFGNCAAQIRCEM